MPIFPEQPKKERRIVRFFHPKPKVLRIGRSGSTEECLACTNEFSIKQLITLACPEKHKYCRHCFQKLVQSGCQNETTFPPQCCQISVSRKLINSHASRKARKAFEVLNKIAEISPENRWYCSHAKCYKLFNVETASKSDKGIQCPHCRGYLCVLCKQQAHRNQLECKNDALKATMETSKQQGWTSCYRCGELVELSSGCRHMTCRCRAEFCYICARKWDTCTRPNVCARKLEESQRESRRNNQDEEVEGDNARDRIAPWEWQENDGSHNMPAEQIVEREALEQAMQVSIRDFAEFGRQRRTMRAREELDVARAIAASLEEPTVADLMRTRRVGVAQNRKRPTVLTYRDNM